MSKRLSASVITGAAWGSAVLAVAVSLTVGLSTWSGRLTPYTVFPLLGLLAYGLMISHYLAGSLRQWTGQRKELLATYFRVTSIAVLICLLLHPGLLVYQLWAHGQGLPPGSYKSYVGSALLIWVYVGTVSWLAFMAYELRYKFMAKTWWPYVQYASDIAMLAIFFHALLLGQHLHVAWFRGVWYLYGLILLASLTYSYWPRRQN